MLPPTNRVYVKPDKPRTPRFAIVGFCSPHRELCPYDDEDLTIAGLNRGYVFMPKYHVWFEMHGPNIYRWPARRPEHHIEWLQAFPGPIYMHVADPDIPNSIAYPLAEVAAELGVGCERIMEDGSRQSLTEHPYFTSSISYQIALAIYEGYEQIELYGVDLNTGGEYAWQKPGVEWLLGVAMARGIRVVVPDNCALLKGPLYGRGFLTKRGDVVTQHQYEVRLAEIREKTQKTFVNYQQALGARAMCQEFLAEMRPGLDHEKSSRRLVELNQAVAQLEGQIQQLQGAERETLYWVSFTPEGQAGDEALKQLAAGPPMEEAGAEPEPLHV